MFYSLSPYLIMACLTQFLQSANEYTATTFNMSSSNIPYILLFYLCDKSILLRKIDNYLHE